MDFYDISMFGRLRYPQIGIQGLLISGQGWPLPWALRSRHIITYILAFGGALVKVIPNWCSRVGRNDPCPLRGLVETTQPAGWDNPTLSDGLVGKEFPEGSHVTHWNDITREVHTADFQHGEDCGLRQKPVYVCYNRNRAFSVGWLSQTSVADSSTNSLGLGPSWSGTKVAATCQPSPRAGRPKGWVELSSTKGLGQNRAWVRGHWWEEMGEASQAFICTVRLL